MLQLLDAACLPLAVHSRFKAATVGTRSYPVLDDSVAARPPMPRCSDFFALQLGQEDGANRKHAPCDL